MAYDSRTYKVGGKIGSLVALDKTSEVEQLNALQWLNAHHNIYFARGQKSFVSAQAPSIIPRRGSEKAIVGEHGLWIKEAEDDPEKQRSLLHEFRPGLNIRLKVSCISLRRHPQHPYYANREAPPRDAGYMQVVEDFRNALSAKRVGAEEFFHFAARHPQAPKHLRR